MKKVLVVLLVAATAASAYTAWPFVDLFRLVRAAQARDVAAVEERVDFRAVRRSFAEQVAAAYFRLSGRPTNSLVSSFLIGASADIADPIVGRLVTPEALINLLTKPDIRTFVPEAPANLQGLSANDFNSVWRLFWHCEYGWGEFWLRIPPDRSQAEQFRLNLRLSGGTWRLVGVDLPDALLVQLAQTLVQQRK